MDSPDLLGDFLQTFAPPHTPNDDEITGFYRRYGPIGDREWMERLPGEGTRAFPELTARGLREPVWRARELAAELQLCCHLYRGLADSRAETIREVLGRAPSSGVLVQILVLGGEVRKAWASEAEVARRVGSFGDWQPTPDDPGRELATDECFGYARSVLTGLLNDYECRCHRQWARRIELPSAQPERRRKMPAKQEPENPLLGGLRTIVFPSLIAALYLGLSDAAEKQRLLRRCRGCQHWFWPDRPNQEYCRTRCSNAYRRRQFTQRHRESATGRGGDAR